MTEHGPNFQHGKSNTSIYNIWRGMIARCDNSKCDSYKRYGARGIKVCERWHEFKNFYLDMGDRPDGYSIDRIDNNKGYFKENCRWATNKEQCNNRNNNRYLEYNGELLSVAEFAELAGISEVSLRKRMEANWTVEEMMNNPQGKHRFAKQEYTREQKLKKRSRRIIEKALIDGRLQKPDRCPKCDDTNVTFFHLNGVEPEQFLDVTWYCRKHGMRAISEQHAAFGKTMSLKDWADYSNISYDCLLNRLNSGINLEEALKTPSKKDKNKKSWELPNSIVDYVANSN